MPGVFAAQRSMPGISATRGPHVLVSSTNTEDWERIPLIYCGIDRAESTGYRLLPELLAEHGDSEEHPIPVAIETSRGILRADQAHQPPLVEEAFGKQTLALLPRPEAACTAADQLAEAVEEAFPQTRMPRSC